MLQKKNKKINARLGEIGKILNMNCLDVTKSKRTTWNIICVCVVAGIIALVSLFYVARLGPAGLWYGPISIDDFNFFKGLV